jgi:hypothetical protein
VTASDCSIENCVILKKLASWPTSVMSVPCSVVITLIGSSRPSISRAR